MSDVAVIVVDPKGHRTAQLVDPNGVIDDLIQVLIKRLSLRNKQYRMVWVDRQVTLTGNSTLKLQGVPPGAVLQLQPAGKALADILYEKLEEYVRDQLWDLAKQKLAELLSADPDYPDPKGLRVVVERMTGMTWFPSMPPPAPVVPPPLPVAAVEAAPPAAQGSGAGCAVVIVIGIVAGVAWHNREAVIQFWNENILQKKLDDRGNPVDGGLAKGRKYSDRILAWGDHHEVRQNILRADNPMWQGLRNRGFTVEMKTGRFEPEWLNNVNQLWIFSGDTRSPGMDEAAYAAVQRFVDNGGKLYLVSDNDPLTAESDQIARRLFGSQVRGNYPGDRIASVRGRSLSAEQKQKFKGDFEIDDHVLLTDINFLYEGMTVSSVSTTPDLQSVLVGPQGEVVLAVAANGRAVFDTGWTRYWYIPNNPQSYIEKTAGTVRLAENIAAYLAGAR